RAVGCLAHARQRARTCDSTEADARRGRWCHGRGDRVHAAARVTRGFARRRWNGRPTTAEKPLRDELLSIEGLEERALALAASFTIDPDHRRRGHTHISQG